MNSKIAWCHATFNPWLGCTEVSPGCDHCYAKTLTTNRMGLSVWGPEAPRNHTSKQYWRQPFVWDRAAEKAGESARVFCGSLCDVMERREELNPWRRDLYDVVERTDHLDWLLLTKRPMNFRRFLPAAWLDEPRHNVWLMTTVESPAQLWRTDFLVGCPATVRALSVEPLLAPMPTLGEHLDAIDLVIVGAESGPKARPMEDDWVRSIRDQCLATNTKFLYKQQIVAGKKVELPEIDGRQWAELPEARR